MAGRRSVQFPSVKRAEIIKCDTIKRSKSLSHDIQI